MSQLNGVSSFANDVLKGLSDPVKSIPIKYGYDDIGSGIYQKICAMPEYYPAQCELEILSTQASQILNSLQFEGEFNVVDLGCGDGGKVLPLLQEFQKKNADFEYIPMDISPKALQSMSAILGSTLPEVQITPHMGDFFSVLPSLQIQNPSLFLLLGCTIGNYTKGDGVEFLAQVRQQMRPGDKILIGHDLRSKSPNIIQAAYDDPTGFEKAYNINIIRRMRTELEMNIDEHNFDYFVSYNPESGELRGFLISLNPQTVFSKGLNETFNFQKWETVGTMFAVKYTLQEFTSIMSSLQFNLIQHFLDSKLYLSCSLFEKVGL